MGGGKLVGDNPAAVCMGCEVVVDEVELYSVMGEKFERGGGFSELGMSVVLVGEIRVVCKEDNGPAVVVGGSKENGDFAGACSGALNWNNGVVFCSGLEFEIVHAAGSELQSVVFLA